MPSQAIHSFSYDASRNELTVNFTNGRGYVYSLVPPDVFAALSAAVSKGAFVNRQVRDHYPFRRLEAEPDPTARASLLAALKASRGEGS